MINALSFDLEAYFHAEVLRVQMPEQAWDAQAHRLEVGTQKILRLLDRHGVRATFFTLAWVAERAPDLVREIARAGHEIASHGSEHGLVFNHDRSHFEQDVRHSKQLLESLSAAPVVGYRAPCFSIVKDTLWAQETLVRLGFHYDSSIFPIRHDRYGIPDAERFIHVVNTSAGALLEFPMSTWRVAGVNLPVAGGGYFRLLPYALIRHGLRRVIASEGQPVIFYLHPWELDPEQPRFALPLLSRWRHYGKLSRTEAKLDQLLQDFAWAPVREVLAGRLPTPAEHAS